MRYSTLPSTPLGEHLRKLLGKPLALVFAQVFALGLVLWPAGAHAAEWTITPSAKASFFFNDNVFLEDVTGYGWNYGAALRMTRDTRRSSAVLSSNFDLQTFLEDEDSNFDRVNHGHTFGLNYQLGKRWSSSTSASVRVSDNIQQALELSGIETDETTRLSANVSQSLSYALSKRDSLSLSYAYTPLLNESDDFADSRSHRASLRYGHAFTSRTSLSLSGSYANIRFEPTDEDPEIMEDAYTTSVGISHQATKRLSLNASVGATYLDAELDFSGLVLTIPVGVDVVFFNINGIQIPVRATPAVLALFPSGVTPTTVTFEQEVSVDDLSPEIRAALFNEDPDGQWSFTGGLGMTYSYSDRGAWSLSASRAVRQTVQSGSSIVNSFNTALSYRLTDRLSSSVGGSYITAKRENDDFADVIIDDDDDVDNDSESAQGRFSLSYDIPLSKRWNAGVNYSFLYRYDFDDDESDTSNRVSVGVSWSFPYKP